MSAGNESVCKSALWIIPQKINFLRIVELKDQLRRSAVSIMANIAEGFQSASNKDFTKFLDYSRASIAETVSHCYVALDLNYVEEIEMGEVKSKADIIRKKINSLIYYLKKNGSRTNQTNQTN